MLLLLAGLLLARDVPRPAEVVADAVDHTAVDLWRPWPDADKVLVPVQLPDGTTELFIVDTGAATSVVSDEVAERLGLAPARDAGVLQGLSGQVPWRQTALPRVRIGEFEVHDVDVAVGVPGVPDQLGPLPIAGILGNNVWSSFVLVVDYPADRLELHRPEAWKPPRGGAPLQWDGSGVATLARVWAEMDGRRTRADVLLELDTGAHDLLFLGPTGEPFRAFTTVGEEPILGIGADLDEVPDRQLVQPTRRVTATRVKVGGRTVKVEEPARWLCADGDCPSQGLLPGLVGYQTLRDQRVVIDYARGRLHVGRTAGPARDFDALAAWLELEGRTRGEDASRADERANVRWASGDEAGAVAELQRGLAARPDDPELVVMLAWTERIRGRWDDAIRTLERLTPDQLAEARAWKAYIGSLILAGRVEEAATRAQAAVDADGDAHAEDFLVALSDARLAQGRLDAADHALRLATEASRKGGSAHLLRRARVAAIAGDRYGAIVPLRELMDHLPLQGLPMWLYATLAGPADHDTLRADVARALARLHPGDEPLDFVGAAWWAIGDAEAARRVLAEGRARDCAPLRPGADRDNCEAWYLALAHEDLGRAETLIQAAIAEEPGNPAYRDTAAVVAAAAGQPLDALERARYAARLDPDDPYLLWQVTRLEAAARAAGAGS